MKVTLFACTRWIFFFAHQIRHLLSIFINHITWDMLITCIYTWITLKLYDLLSVCKIIKTFRFSCIMHSVYAALVDYTRMRRMAHFCLPRRWQRVRALRSISLSSRTPFTTHLHPFFTLADQFRSAGAKLSDNITRHDNSFFIRFPRNDGICSRLNCASRPLLVLILRIPWLEKLSGRSTLIISSLTAIESSRWLLLYLFVHYLLRWIFLSRYE